jgi:ATP-dependent DNA helicase DinG
MEKTNALLDMDEFFAPTGPIGRAVNGYEHRRQQAKMASAVQKALVEGYHLVAEAGTGVGKSLAYLVPAIERAVSSGARIVISTFTISLQEQLITKDIPCLDKCLSTVGAADGETSPAPKGRGGPWNFKAVLAKGRGNYLCKRRLEFAIRRQAGLFDQFGDALAEISNWASKTKDGSLSDLPFVPDSRVWDAVRAEHGNCRGRKCGHFAGCFCQRARRELENANLIITNHALLFSDLVLREQEVSLLPDFKWVVIDEAHNIERVAEDHFGIDISAGSVKFLLDGLYNPRTHKGLLVWTRSGETNKLTNLVVEAGESAKEFFRSVRRWYDNHKENTNGSCYVNFVEDTLSANFKSLRAALSELAKQTKDEDERFEFMRYVDNCTALLQNLEQFLKQTKQDYVYWVAVDEGRKENVRLKSAPLNVGPDVRKHLFDKFGSVIMTSATISTSENGRQKTEDGECKTGNGFEFFAGRVGLEDYQAVKLGSPFNYEKQATIFIERNLPEPNNEKFVEAGCEAIKKYLLRTQGRAFVLFTSYQMIENFAGKLAGWFEGNNIVLLRQGIGLDRSSLLRRFKSHQAGGRFVLFGTDSFWQGVDVAGEALSNVIIVRLPFAVPDTPLLAGRLDQIRQQGGNPFLEYQLPLAIIKFKQGFGRLIRTKTDTGIVVILDSRVINKSYGRSFLSAIPKCKVEIVSRS